MSVVDIKIPSIGESITEVTLSEWLVKDGDYINQGDIICELESDKATVEMPAESSGAIKITAEEGQEYEIGAKIGELDTSASAGASSSSSEKPQESTASETTTSQAPATSGDKNFPSPAAQKILNEKNVDPNSVQGTGKDGRITKADAMNVETASPKKSSPPPTKEVASTPPSFGGSREKKVEKMSGLRKTIAKVLVEAKNTTAMLTTFNEVDMYAVMELRKKYKDAFKEKHDVGLGFMSFFTKACCMALKEYPGVNSQIDGTNMVSFDYVDMGIAVSTPKGLVVPVVRNAESLSLANIEKGILSLALKARDGKISLEEMQGGTFTITNGGIFGSMLSTPIINIPQSAILGMHNIVQRPVAVNGQVVIRPIMYIALSYDHRVIDGRESVSFLKTVKELIEDPSRLLLDV
ncbi:MAG: 2-oxoglutarate dehydrogenase complex dihydrolipoyllysine-residue succinyltransferase [Bdellovibrionales bacterium]|nr:2-oxoglutarate dehydrogenase complex dihydrolipoyllysine-residue succinyltransferase [Bdellovibrionales bacterium]